MIQVRREHKVFGRGSLEFLPCHNRRVVAYVRRLQDEIALVVNNLSRFPQAVELDLSAYSGMTPIEMAGKAPFPDDLRPALPDHARALRLLLAAPREAAGVTIIRTVRGDPVVCSASGDEILDLLVLPRRIGRGAASRGAASGTGGATRVVTMTISVVAPNRPASKTWDARPIRAKISPTSPRGIMPTPTTALFPRNQNGA